MKVAIEIVTHDDDGELIDPPRILLPDGELIKPRVGESGWLFIVDDGKLEQLKPYAKDYRNIAVGSLNRWVLDGATQEERQRRTDMTWRLMEELEADSRQKR